MAKNGEKRRPTAVSRQTGSRNMAETTFFELAAIGFLFAPQHFMGSISTLNAFSKVRFLTLADCKDDGT